MDEQRPLRTFQITATVERIYRKRVQVPIAITAISPMAAHDAVIDEIANGTQYDELIATAMGNATVGEDPEFTIDATCPCDCNMGHLHRSDCIEYRN